MLWRTLVCCLVLAGTVSARHWEKNRGYVYNVKASTWTGIPDVSEVSTGVAYKLKLQLEHQSNALYGKIRKTQQVQISPNAVTEEEDIQDVLFSDPQRIPELETSFKLELKNEVVERILFPQNTPLWVVNMVKGIASLLQHRPLGESVTELPLSYKTNESMILGECLVHYTATPLSPIYQLQYASLDPESNYILLEKSSDLSRCRRLPLFHRNIEEPSQNVQHSFSRDHVVKAIVNETEGGKGYMLVYVEGQNKIAIPPELYGTQKAMTWSNISLSLERTYPIQKSSPPPSRLRSYGDLVYSLENSEDPKQILLRYPHKWESSSSSSSASDSSSVSSSEESQTEKPAWARSSEELYGEDSQWGTFGTLYPYYVKEGEPAELVDQLSNLVIEIAQQLQNISSVPQEATLSAFIQLVYGVRHLDTVQMEAVYQEISQDPVLRVASRNIYQDAVAQAGTYAALQSIESWWREKRIPDEEAAQHIAVLSESVLIPDKQFLNKLWEIAMDPEVQNAPQLNVSSVIAFTNLYNDVVVNKQSGHKLYPSHAVQLPTLTDLPPEKYVKPLGQKLDSAVKRGDSHKALIYITALGNIGHPKIMEYFAPYISGNSSIGEFQRWAIVANLGALAQAYPKQALEILYQIYSNKGESHEIRVAALYHTMRSDRDAQLMQQAAELTQTEPDPQVRSAIQSGLLTTAYQIHGVHNKVRSKNAKSAVDLLRYIQYNYELSQLLHFGNVARESFVGQDIFVGTIGSRNFPVPKGVLLNSILNSGGFKSEHLDFTVMVNDVPQAAKELQQLLQKWISPELEESEQPSDWQEPFEFLWKYDALGTKTVAAGNNLEQIPILQQLSKGIQKLYYSDEVVLKMPNILGLPVQFTKADVNFIAAGIANLNPGEWQSSFIVNASYSTHTEAKLGFFLPFNNVSYTTGLVKSSLINAAPGLQVSYDLREKTNKIAIEIPQEEESAQLLHFSMVPFVTSEQCLALIPTLRNPNTTVIRVGRAQKIQNSLSEQVGMELWYTIETDLEGGVLQLLLEQAKGTNWWERFNSPYNILDELKQYRRYDILTLLSHPSYLGSIFYLNASVNLDLANTRTKSLQLNFETDVAQGEQPIPDMESEDIAWPSDRLPLSEERQQEYIQKAAYLVGNDAGPIARVIDGSVAFGDEAEASLIFTAAYATNAINNNASVLLYKKMFIPEHQQPCELAAHVYWGATQVPLFSLQQVFKNPPRANIEAQLNYINSVSKEVPQGEIKISGEMQVTDQKLQDLINSPIAKECMQQIKEKHRVLYACRATQFLATTFDKYDFNVSYEVPKTLKQIAYSAYSTIRNLYYIHTEEDWFPQEKTPEAKLRLQMNINDTSLDALLSTPLFETYINAVPLGPVTQHLQMIAASSVIKTHAMPESPIFQEPVCVVDYDIVSTFDNTTYQVQLREKQQHILLVLNETNGAQQLSINVSRRGQDGLLLDMYVQNTRIKLWSVGGSPVEGPYLQVDGRVLDVHINRSLSIGSLMQVSRKFISEITLVFNDTYLQRIEFSGGKAIVYPRNALRQKIVGLCGTFSGKPIWDFTISPNCVVKDAKVFANHYIASKSSRRAYGVPECALPAVIKTGLQGYSEMAPKIAEESESSSADSSSSSESSEDKHGTSASESSSSSESVEEPGVSSTPSPYVLGPEIVQAPVPQQCTVHMTSVIVENNQVCFSLRPLPKCNEHCHPGGKIEKQIKFHCMPKGQLAYTLMEKIATHGHVDFSKKTPHIVKQVSLDVKCTPNRRDQ